MDPTTIPELQVLRSLYFRDNDECGIHWGIAIPSFASSNKRARDGDDAGVFGSPPKRTSLQDLSREQGQQDTGHSQVNSNNRCQMSQPADNEFNLGPQFTAEDIVRRYCQCFI
jgi:hypothetical protein